MEFDQVMKELETPVGSFAVTEEDGGKKLPFSVRENPFRAPYESFDENWEPRDVLTTDHNHLMDIETKGLTVGKVYRVCFSAGEFRWCGADEHTEALALTREGWTVGLGMYNPNDDEEIEQAVRYSEEQGLMERRIVEAPPAYDESNMRGYRVGVLEDGFGFWFRLLDRSMEKVTFCAAWMENGTHAERLCRRAMGFWLT